MEIHVSISDEVQEVCPDLHVLVIACDVKNTVSDEQLWKEITDEEITVRASMKLEEINKWQPVFATRQAYKRLGKDPNRYRPSAEALRRRILRGLPLYKVDTLVDLSILLSIRICYSIGGFDASKIVGNELILGVGREGENYQGIGRGDLNIAGLPVYRDVLGGIGTPTSDEERTKISLDTSRLLMIINGYSGEDGLEAAGRYGVDLLRRYVSAINIQAELISGGKRTILLL